MVAGLAGGDVGTDGHDFTGALMAQNLGNGRGGVLQNVQVTVADGRGANLHQDLIGLGLVELNLADLQGLADTGHNRCSHFHSGNLLKY